VVNKMLLSIAMIPQKNFMNAIRACLLGMSLLQSSIVFAVSFCDSPASNATVVIHDGNSEYGPNVVSIMDLIDKAEESHWKKGDIEALQDEFAQRLLSVREKAELRRRQPQQSRKIATGLLAYYTQ
jgi:hypothetical protein